MKLDSIYIISYINNEKYKQRSKVIIQQAKWLSQINELNEINYLTQNWDSNLKNSILDIYKNCNKNIIFEEYNYQIKTSIARNKNFKKFYESDKDIAIFMDDDITVETLDKINVFEYYYKYIFNKVKFDVIGFENLKCIKEENCYSIIKHTLWNGRALLSRTPLLNNPVFVIYWWHTGGLF